MSTIPRKVFIQVDPVEEQVIALRIYQLLFKVIKLFTAIVWALVCVSCYYATLMISIECVASYLKWNTFTFASFSIVNRWNLNQLRFNSSFLPLFVAFLISSFSIGKYKKFPQNIESVAKRCHRQREFDWTPYTKCWKNTVEKVQIVSIPAFQQWWSLIIAFVDLFF